MIDNPFWRSAWRVFFRPAWLFVVVARSLRGMRATRTLVGFYNR
jgi:hypothetical protein